jgi:hypothetical protein
MERPIGHWFAIDACDARVRRTAKEVGPFFGAGTRRLEIWRWINDVRQNNIF